MNKKFTKLIAALALLAFMTPSLAGWGQTNSTYTKVTSAPSDWSGEYLLVYEEGTTAYVWTGVDGGSCYKTATLANTITIPQGAVSLTIASMTDGYSIMVNGGTNNGKYISGTSGNNTLVFGTTAVLNSISIESNSAKIVSNTSVLRFNSNSDQMRFRYFKSASYSSQKVVQLYKLDASTTTPSITISGAEISNNAVSFDWNITTDHTASVVYQNLDERVAELCLYETYENGECSNKVEEMSDYWLLAMFGANDNDEEITYAATDVNGNADDRTVYMRVEATDGSEIYSSNVIAITQTGKPKYTVTYDGNGATSGTVPVDLNSPYFINSNVTILGNTGSLVKTSHTFGGWCLDAAGTGTVYSPNQSYNNITNDITFYAKWIPNSNSYTLNVIGETHLEERVEIFVPDQEGWEAGDDIQFGQQVTVSVIPSSGYTYSITVTDEDENDVPVEQDMFEMPDSDVTILVTVEKLGYNATYTSNVTIDGSDRVVISDVEYAAKRAGTSNNAGSWTVTVPVNTTKLHLHFAGWTSEDVTLTVTPSGYSDNISLTRNSGVSGNSTTYTWGSGNDDKDPSSSYHYKVITFDGPLEEAVTLTFTASSGKRFLVWGVNAEATTDPYITAADVDIASTTTSGSIAYTVHNIPDPAGTLTAAVTTGSDWLELGTVGTTVPFTCTANPNTVERTATVTLTYTYGDNETTTEIVTVTQAALVVTYTYTLATSIENGKHYIITNGGTKIMGAQGSNNRTAVDVSSAGYYDSDNNEFSIPSNADIYEFVINGPDADGYYTIHDAKPNTGYLYAASGGNYLKTQSFNNDNGRWIIKFTDNGDTIVAQGSNTNNNMRYNSSGWFSCYGKNSSVTALPYLYVRNDSYYEFYKDIAKYTTPTGDDPVNGWNFIASPLANAYTLSGSSMVTGTYDLYRLNNTQWENYKNNEHSDFTTLNNGTGYLYANSANTTLHFSGAINEFPTEGNVEQTLDAGWNLIGNPYNIPIYIDKSYYKMNAAGTAVETSDGITSVAIPACTGVVVYAGENETVTFSTSVPSNSTGNNGNIQMVLAQQATNRGTAATIDNAIVSFNEGSQLGKFYFGTQNANLYIPQGTEEYAIVSSNGQGTMPVNFRANENGQYTLTVNPENVEMNYLHLIDNMTGADIDLLANPSYSFNANVTDYESRFKLVFASDASTGSASDETFAFYSNGNWVINNAGNATLQVVDVMGRILKSESINGSVSKTINATPGVYMLRLINGENVKVQKVVIE